MSASATVFSRLLKIVLMVLAFTLTIGAGSVAWSRGVESLADRLGISGNTRVSFYTKDASFVDAPGVQNDSIWITAKPHEIAEMKSYFDARVQGQFVSGNSKISGDLREGYVERTLDRFDVKVGRQIVVWGRADKINPTDSWSIRDYKLLVTDDDDQRVGAVAAQVVWNVGAEHIVAIWQPEFRYPSLPVPPLPAGTSLSNLGVRRKLEQLGIKFDHSGAGVDWSVSYAHPINRTPDLVLLDSHSSKAGQTNLGLSYKFADVIGADVAVPVGSYGFRGEVAYTHTRNSGGLDPLAQHSNVFGVLGVERTWEGKLNVNLQYLHRRSYDFRNLDSISDPRLRFLAGQAKVISNQLAENMDGVSLRVDYKALNETLETEVSAAMWFKKTDSFVTAKISYAFTDRLKGIVGGNVFSGPADSFFGRLRHTSAAFLEFRLGL